jgi:hypothetical protein
MQIQKKRWCYDPVQKIFRTNILHNEIWEYQVSPNADIFFEQLPKNIYKDVGKIILAYCKISIVLLDCKSIKARLGQAPYYYSNKPEKVKWMVWIDRKLSAITYENFGFFVRNDCPIHLLYHEPILKKILSLFFTPKVIKNEISKKTISFNKPEDFKPWIWFSNHHKVEFLNLNSNKPLMKKLLGHELMHSPKEPASIQLQSISHVDIRRLICFYLHFLHK